jgi:hypothetical protein
MKKTKIFAAMAALSFAGAAQAVPIAFEFSGAVQQVSVGAEQWIGQRATGRFLIESDNFTLLPTPVSQPIYTWTDALPYDARPAPLGASISVGADHISLNTEVEVYGGITFVDACRPACLPNSPEAWSISANTQSYALGSSGWEQGYTMSSLSFRSSTPFDVEQQNSFDFFDGNGLTPEAILSLPLLSLTASYHQWIYECRDEVPEDEDRCVPISQISMNFLVDTVTRTVVSQSVPEPGTLGLLGLALIGGAFARRRAASH